MMDGYDEIEIRLKKEIEESVPDVLDSVLAKAQKQSKPQENNLVVLAKPNRRKAIVRAISSVAAIFLIVLIGAVVRQSQSRTFDVEIDVNPGVILEVNGRKRVTDVITLNSDGEKVLDGMDLTGSNLDVAINALMFSIIKNGYIDEMTNSVLVTLTDNSGISGKDFTTEIADQITASLRQSSIEGSVLVQSAEKTDELTSLSEQYGITIGKASLIKHLIDSDKTAFTFAQLAALSVNELNVLMSEQSITQGVCVTGSASRKAYIGENAAKSIAYAAANVTKQQVTKTECKLDLDDGVLAYEVEFEADGLEYECDINALTGEVLTCKSEKEEHDGKNETSIPDTVVFKTKEEIKDSLLKKNGLTASECHSFEIELDYEDGVAKYEVEFISGDTEYEYEVNAVSGVILSYSYQNIPQAQPAEAGTTVTESARTTAARAQTTTGQAAITDAPETATAEKTTEAEPTLIGAENAKRIALRHAGLSAEKVSVSVEKETDDDTKQVVYKVELKYGGYEYEYEINAYTGDILDFEKEKDD